MLRCATCFVLQRLALLHLPLSLLVLCCNLSHSCALLHLPFLLLLLHVGIGMEAHANTSWRGWFHDLHTRCAPYGGTGSARRPGGSGRDGIRMVFCTRSVSTVPWIQHLASMSLVGGWRVDLPTQPGNRLRFVRASMHALAERHPLYASIRPGMSCFASRGRGRGHGLGVAVGTAVGTVLGEVVGVAVGMDTASGAAVGPPNLPIPLAGCYGYFTPARALRFCT
jgi:hypothetical protein